MLNETNVKCFISLGQTLDIHDTAKELGLSPQTVSRNIDKLEQRVGHVLFIRVGSAVVLTPIGCDFHQAFVRFSETYQNLQRVSSARKTSVAQAITIGLLDWANTGRVLSNALDRMAVEEPDLQVSFSFRDPGALLFDLGQNKFDVIITFERYFSTENLSGNYRILPLMEAELLVAVSTSYPMAESAENYLVFAKEPFIVENFAMEGREETIRRAKVTADKLGLTPSQFIISPNRESSHTLCECGRGCLLTTDVSRFINASSMRFFSTGLKDNIVCVVPEKYESPSLEQLIRLLREEFQRLRK